MPGESVVLATERQADEIEMRLSLPVDHTDNQMYRLPDHPLHAPD